MIKSIIYIHNEAGFELRNFVSNSKKVLEELGQTDFQNSNVNMKLKDVHETQDVCRSSVDWDDTIPNKVYNQ